MAMTPGIPDFWYSLIPEGKLGYAWKNESGRWVEGMNYALDDYCSDPQTFVPNPSSMFRLRAADLMADAANLMSRACMAEYCSSGGWKLDRD
jgi:hypothetical protein